MKKLKARPVLGFLCVKNREKQGPYIYKIRDKKNVK